MNIKSMLALYFAKKIQQKLLYQHKNALYFQNQIFEKLIKIGKKTQFGTEHQFDNIKNYEDFKQAVPIRDYEQIKKYIELVKTGKKNILWRGKPIYFAKTSGTTSGVKYIPITPDSIFNHIHSARNAILCYIAEKKDASLVEGKMIFLSGSPILQKLNGIFIGRLSGIVNHHIPAYLKSNQLPSFNTNCIEDWETKIEKIVEETMGQDMRLISGIPPWMIMYFEKLMDKKNKTIHQIFPNLKLIIHGGVNFQPYKQKIDECLGKNIDSIELFPASEGFFAFQNNLLDDGLLLNINSGIYYEFIPMDEMGSTNPTRINLADVKLNTQYALIISSYAGLWAYNVGDTIKFVSLNPYKIRVTGRIKHFISAFGEHVITEEVEKSIIMASQKFPIQIIEFTVAPIIKDVHNESYHEWYIEFEDVPTDISFLEKEIDNNLRKLNIYYNDLIEGNILKPLKIITIKKNGFVDYMRSINKLGSQNKLPRLSNDRNIADSLQPFILQKKLYNEN